MDKARFFASYSHLYGWAVYDRDTGCTPAYFAVSTLLPMLTTPDGTQVSESCTHITQHHAYSLVRRLTRAYEKRKALESYRIEQSPYGLWYINYYIGDELQFDVYGGYKSRSVAKGIATRKGITVKEEVD